MPTNAHQVGTLPVTCFRIDSHHLQSKNLKTPTTFNNNIYKCDLFDFFTLRRERVGVGSLAASLVKSVTGKRPAGPRKLLHPRQDFSSTCPHQRRNLPSRLIFAVLPG
jgi:hypothetical protein